MVRRSIHLAVFAWIILMPAALAQEPLAWTSSTTSTAIVEGFDAAQFDTFGLAVRSPDGSAGTIQAEIFFRELRIRQFEAS